MKSRAQILAETFEGHDVDYSKIWADADPDWKRRWEAVADVEAATPLYRVDTETGEICIVATEPCGHCPDNGVVVQSYDEPRFVHWRDLGPPDETPIGAVNREISRLYGERHPLMVRAAAISKRLGELQAERRRLEAAETPQSRPSE